MAEFGLTWTLVCLQIHALISNWPKILRSRVRGGVLQVPTACCYDMSLSEEHTFHGLLLPLSAEPCRPSVLVQAPGEPFNLTATPRAKPSRNSWADNCQRIHLTPQAKALWPPWLLGREFCGARQLKTDGGLVNLSGAGAGSQCCWRKRTAWALRLVCLGLST